MHPRAMCFGLILVGNLVISAAFVVWIQAETHVLAASSSLAGDIELAALTRLATPLHHPDGVRAVAFSPDSRIVATAGRGPILFWDSGTGKELRSLAGHQGETGCLVFAGDGKQLFSGSLAESAVICWSTESGKEICRFQTDSTGVVDLAVAKDGKLLAARTRQARVYLFDIERQIESRNFRDTGGILGFVMFSPGGELLASGTDGAPTRMWRTSDGTEVDSTSSRHGSRGVFMEDGKKLILAGHGNAGITIHALQEPKDPTRFPEPIASCSRLSMTRDCKLLVASGRVVISAGQNSTEFGNRVFVLETATRKCICRIVIPNGSGWSPSEVSSDGKFIAVTASDIVHLMKVEDLLKRSATEK